MKIRSRFNLLDPTPLQRVLLHVLFWLLLLGLRFYLTLISFNVYSGFPVEYLLVSALLNTSLIAAAFYVIVGPVTVLVKKRRKFAVVLSMVAILFCYTVLDAAAEQLIVRSCGNCLSVLKESQAGYYELLQSGLINIVLKRLLSMGTPFFCCLH